MTTEEKDAEIERLKDELAEAFRLLKPFDDWFTLDVYAVKSACFAAKAFLQKHTPPNCGSAAAGGPCDHKHVNQGVLGDEGYVVICRDCGADLSPTPTRKSV